MNKEIKEVASTAEADALAEKQMSEAGAKDSASRDFYSAAMFAKRSAQQDGLTPEIRPYGEVRYSVQQGLKAACHAREDVTAVLLIQKAVLRRLENLRVLVWICLAVLVYVAVRVS